MFKKQNQHIDTTSFNIYIYIYIYNIIKKCKKYRLKPTENPVGFLRFLEVSNG